MEIAISRQFLSPCQVVKPTTDHYAVSVVQLIGENSKYFESLTDNQNKNMQHDKGWATDREIFAMDSMLGATIWVNRPY